MTRFVEAVITTPEGREERLPIREGMAQKLAQQETPPAGVHTTSGKFIEIGSIRFEEVPASTKP